MRLTETQISWILGSDLTVEKLAIKMASNHFYQFHDRPPTAEEYEDLCRDVHSFIKAQQKRVTIERAMTQGKK